MNKNNGCLKGGVNWLGKQEGLYRANGNGLSREQCELQRCAHLPKFNDLHTLDLCASCMYIISQEKIFYNVIHFLKKKKGNIKKLFLCFLTPKPWLSACSPCRIEISGILRRVMCGSMSMFIKGSEGYNYQCHDPLQNTTKGKRIFYSSINSP